VSRFDHDDANDDAMQVDLGDDTVVTATYNSECLAPMAKPDSITALRDGFDLRMTAVQRGGQAGADSGDKDVFLEE
jgi:hypothetical protein